MAEEDQKMEVNSLDDYFGDIGPDEIDDQKKYLPRIGRRTWLFDHYCPIFHEAKGSMKTVGDEIFFIAQVLRKYSVKYEDFDAGKTLVELVSKMPSRDEQDRYDTARKAVTGMLNTDGYTIMKRQVIVGMLEELYFSPDYRLPELPQ